ncbi:MAG: hydantoinase B/oxoprolinase family protein [Thermogemmatispora sp.]|jgi:N-methylhydantoinase B|uniref:5-oxoprolinase n=1 Tax=Thermogemmatispora aurantia TaxID=2045279 RepID=A0A5J4K977_9CHLR|nr:MULTISPECIES: hydantoinase B/oxoprolinase family protein [Thermogemmatispora]MBE3566539.1 hydantoinase B/oxoprolinase family protein [Thermogemmatispora sp.]GER83632.1 5-oxoprolinase [Thermogemmatispora aurantia]
MVRVEPPVLIKDLDEDAFRARYQCDRFTATVLSSRLRYIVQHMCTGLLTNAFSVILRDWYDFASTIAGPPELDYPTPAVSNSLVLFLGTMTDAVRNAVEEFGPQNLQPGDVLMCNDPYRIGTHVNDVCFIRPVFFEGRLVGFVNLQAHMLDMGGVVPAGFSGTKRNVYENGLVIGPQLLYHDDRPVKSAWSLIFDNARFGNLLLPDIKTIYQNLRLGENLLLETIQRYGVESYLGAVRYACDLSAETMRQALARLPDGEFEGEDFIDCDGVDDSEEYHVKVKVRIRGDRAEVDLSGSSRQARTSINGGWLDAKTAVAVALKYLLDPRSPFTSGTLRNVDIVLPEGTFFSAMPPDGAIFLYWESTQPLLLAIFRALKEALGPNAVGGDYCSLNIHNANGVRNGVPWVTMAQCGGEHGPWGATKDGDADSYMVFYLANNLDPATEAIEADFPCVVLRKEYATDTAGAGRHRGGAAVVKDTLWLTEAEHYSMPLHTKAPSGFGVYGGKDGAVGAVWVWEPEAYEQVQRAGLVGFDEAVYRQATPVAGVLNPESHTLDHQGRYFHFARVPIWRTRPRTMFRYLTNGGGGWGNPLERPPERVLRDVRDEYISIETARELYGVVIQGDPQHDPEGLQIDYEATQALRNAAASQRH